jgi:hypothetical protein
MTPSAIRKRVEALARERDVLLHTVAEAERRADELNQVVKAKRQRLASILVELAECTPT